MRGRLRGDRKLIDLVDRTALTERLGARSKTVDRWLRRGVLPRPALTFRDEPIWSWTVVNNWASRTSRTLRAAQTSAAVEIDLVGREDIAERLNVDIRTVEQWQHTNALPAPDYRWYVGDAWLWETIETWAEGKGRAVSRRLLRQSVVAPTATTPGQPVDAPTPPVSAPTTPATPRWLPVAEHAPPMRSKPAAAAGHHDSVAEQPALRPASTPPPSEQPPAASSDAHPAPPPPAAPDEHPATSLEEPAAALAGSDGLPVTPASERPSFNELREAVLPPPPPPKPPLRRRRRRRARKRLRRAGRTTAPVAPLPEPETGAGQPEDTAGRSAAGAETPATAPAPATPVPGVEPLVVEPPRPDLPVSGPVAASRPPFVDNPPTGRIRALVARAVAAPEDQDGFDELDGLHDRLVDLAEQIRSV